MAGIVREFETLRDFSRHTSTVVILVDLPFVFFFIWVISLIAGPIAIVPPHRGAAGDSSWVSASSRFLMRDHQRTPWIMRDSRSRRLLVETLSGLETVNATGSGRLMRKRY